MADDAYAGGRTPSPRREQRGEEYANGGDSTSGVEPRREESQGADVNTGNNLHVAGLAQRTKDSDLEEIFGKFGKITKAQIMRDPHTRDSRGFGFVTFETAEDADAAMAALNATTLDDRTITVEKARRGRARTPTPGSYRGPAKRPGDRGPPRRDDRRFDDRRRDDRFDDRRGFMAAAPMREPERGYGGRGLYDDRRALYDDRRYDDRGRGYDDRPPRPYDDRMYDDRRRGYDDRPPRFDDRLGGYDRRPPPPPVAAPYDDRRGYGAPVLPPAPYDLPPRRERERDYYDDRRPYRDEPPRRY